MTLNHASKLFDNDMALFACVEAHVCRSLPTRSVLRDKRNEDLVNTLKRAVQQHDVEAFGLEDDPGLQEHTNRDTSTQYMFRPTSAPVPKLVRKVRDIPGPLRTG